MDQIEWIPPPLGEVKTFAGVILRNHTGKIIGAWTDGFLAPSVFYADLCAALLSLEIGEKLGLEKGDSISVILAMKGCNEYAE